MKEKEQEQTTPAAQEILEGVVGFYCPAYNRMIEVTHPQSLTADPRAFGYPDRKMVQFREGWYSTDDPEIIEVLDKRSDVYRADDEKVAALEEVNHLEPEEKAQSLRLLEKVGNIGSFHKQKANVPSLVSREKI